MPVTLPKAPIERTVAPVEAPYVQEEQPLGEIMQDRVTELFEMQLAARERRQSMFRTLQATARLQAELGKAAPATPPKAAPKVLADRLQAERGKAAPATPYKAAPKVLGLPGSSATEASTLEMDEDVVEGLDFASQFSPPFGTERQYLDLEVAAPAEEVLEHPAPAHVEEESGQPASPTAGVEAEGSDSRGLKAAKSAARRLRFSTGARAARDDGGTTGPGTHAVQRAGRRAVGLLARSKSRISWSDPMWQRVWQG